MGFFYMQSEDNMLAQCHLWLWNNYPELRYCCWHVANERITSVRHGGMLKAKGVVGGVPDYVINFDGKTYYVELKTETGIISPAQKKLHIALKKQDFDVKIIRSLDEFKIFVTNLISCQN
jgi:hypothetical protein